MACDYLADNHISRRRSGAMVKTKSVVSMSDVKEQIEQDGIF